MTANVYSKKNIPGNFCKLFQDVKLLQLFLLYSEWSLLFLKFRPKQNWQGKCYFISCLELTERIPEILLIVTF